MNSLPEPRAILQLRFTIMEIEPAIWRRVLVPSFIHLGQLHDVIQCVVGWTDSHLHEFEVGDRRYGDPMPDYDGPGRVYQERNAKLASVVVNAGDTILYIYDLGDYWRHEIAVEEILPADTGRPTATCLGGERSCPPEDVGGPWGYQEFLAVIADPTHEDHEHLVGWAGEDFDPEAFDLERTNVYLTNLSGRWRAPRSHRPRSSS